MPAAARGTRFSIRCVSAIQPMNKYFRWDNVSFGRPEKNIGMEAFFASKLIPLAQHASRRPMHDELAGGLALVTRLRKSDSALGSC